MITLYFRCFEYHVLPEAGGLYQQPEKIMQCFDVVSSEVEKYKIEKQKENESKQQARMWLAKGKQ